MNILFQVLSTHSQQSLSSQTPKGANCCRKGVFITTSGFSKPAHDYLRGIQDKVILIDGPTLAELLIDHGVGVSTLATYEVKKIDSDYFSED